MAFSRTEKLAPNKNQAWRPGTEYMVDRQGFEPWTLGLRVPCSTS